MVKHNTDTNGIGYEWEYAKVKDDRTIWQKIAMGIYNPSSHEVLGRSAKSWGGILLFYVMFYSSLAALFGICMKILLSTLDDHTPHFILDNSIIGTSPGLGFRPMSPNVEDGSLIYYEADNTTNIKFWTNELDNFLEGYKNKSKLPNKGENQQKCDYNQQSLKDSKKVCEFKLDNMGPCTSSNNYGFSDNSPCIFIKLNKIFDWRPQFYEADQPPDDMPESLRNLIKEKNKKNQIHTVWVTCDGEEPADRDSIGPLEMYPKDLAGFPGYYYPYTNENDYLSPLIAVHFKNPKRHTLINVECRAWAQNIKYKRSAQNREGSVHFELMID